MALYFNGTEIPFTQPVSVNGSCVDRIDCDGKTVWEFKKKAYLVFELYWEVGDRSPLYGANLVVIGKKAAAYQVSGDTETGIGYYSFCEDSSYYKSQAYIGAELYFDGKEIYDKTHEDDTSSCSDWFRADGKLQRRKIFPVRLWIRFIEFADFTHTPSHRIKSFYFSRAKVTNTNGTWNFTQNLSEEQEDVSSCGTVTEFKDSVDSFFALYSEKNQNPTKDVFSADIGSRTFLKDAPYNGEGWDYTLYDNTFYFLAEPTSVKKTYDTSYGINGIKLRIDLAGEVTLTSGEIVSFSRAMDRVYPVLSDGKGVIGYYLYNKTTLLDKPVTQTDF